MIIDKELQPTEYYNVLERQHLELTEQFNKCSKEWLEQKRKIQALEKLLNVYRYYAPLVKDDKPKHYIERAEREYEQAIGGLTNESKR